MIIEPRLLSVVISLQSVLPGESCKESLLVGEVRSLDFCGAGGTTRGRPNYGRPGLGYRRLHDFEVFNVSLEFKF